MVACFTGGQQGSAVGKKLGSGIRQSWLSPGPSFTSGPDLESNWGAYFPGRCLEA